MAVTTTTTNNSVRRTLASQLDRLDSILDGLAEALDGAVASAVGAAVERAVRQAVGQAVQEAMQAVLTEVLTNADLLAAVRGILPAPPPPAAPMTDPPERPRGLFRRACDKVKADLGAAGTACAAVAGQAAGVKAVARAGWQLARKFNCMYACHKSAAVQSATLLRST